MQRFIPNKVCPLLLNNEKPPKEHRITHFIPMQREALAGCLCCAPGVEQAEDMPCARLVTGTQEALSIRLGWGEKAGPHGPSLYPSCLTKGPSSCQGSGYPVPGTQQALSTVSWESKLTWDYRVAGLPRPARSFGFSDKGAKVMVVGGCRGSGARSFPALSYLVAMPVCP